MMTSKMGERDSREEIMKAFKLFDDDNTGFITLKNLKRVAKELGENLTDEELQASGWEAGRRDGAGGTWHACTNTRMHTRGLQPARATCLLPHCCCCSPCCCRCAAPPAGDD